jgi:flagellar protein FliO/FliZ
MFETWSGMPLPVQFLLAFVIILAVIGAAVWAVRRFGSGRLGTNTRGRQPRLAVIDYASVDNRRRLILVRRDNIEHLLMIGGPTDIVVEPNIVRAIPATRDIGRAPAGIEAITRAIPLPDNGGGSWPLQPDANGGSRPGQRPDAPHDDIPGRPQSEPRNRDTLAALADELSTRMTPPPRNRGSVAEPPRPEQRQEPRQESQRQEPRLEPRKPAQAAAPAAPPPSTPSATSDAAASGDQNLADMAQRLEAALRKPPGEGRTAGTQARPATSPEPPRSEASSSPSLRNPRGGEQRPAAPEAGKPNQNKTAIYDTLEQEMANLLGRPSKT